MRRFEALAAVLALALTGSTLAGQELSLGTASVNRGQVVEIPLIYTGDGSAVGLQIDIAFDTAVLDAPAAAGGEALDGHVLRSAKVSSGLLRLVVYSPSNAALSDGALARLSFTVDDAAPTGPSEVSFSAVTLGNAAAGRLTPASLTPGSVDVLEPGSYYTVTPCRVVDTRDPEGPRGGPILASGVPRLFTVEGECEIPSTASSVSVNITVVSPTAAGHLTLYPGGQTPPQTSTINFGAGQARANNAILPLSADGVISARPVVLGNGKVHLIIDINGYFD